MKNLAQISTILGWIVSFVLGIASLDANAIVPKVNTPPTITANTISVSTGSGGIEKEIATALDAESDNLEVTASNLPANITLSNIENSDGTVTALVNVGCYVSMGTYTATLTVKDPEGESASASLTIIVTANTMPVIGYATSASVISGGSISITPTAGPSDNSNDFTVGVNDQGTFTGTISVDPLTGVISISNAAPVGTHQITIKISETCEFEETSTFELTVTNTSPIITGATVSRQQGTLTGLTSMIATVNDAETAAESLNVTLKTPLPLGISVTGVTNVNGAISANVRATCFAAIGNNVIELTVTDANGGTATANLIVNVTSNSLPTITYSDQTVNAMASLTIHPASGPSDNGEFGGITISNVGGFTGDIDVDPTTGVVTVNNAAPVGVHTITVEIMDNCEEPNEATISLTVVNAKPTITGSMISRQQGSAAIATTIANVDDAETARGSLTVTATTVPSGISVSNITNTNGVISATVSAGCNATLGENTVVLTVTDGDGATATANLIVNVTINSAPTLSYSNSIVSLAGSTTITPLTGPTDNGTYGGLTVVNMGSFTGNISVDPETGILSVSNAAPVGVHAVTVRVYDNCEDFTETTFNLSVEGCTTTLTAGVVTNPTTCTTPLGSIAFTTNLANGDYTLSFTSSAGGTASPQSIKVMGGAFLLGSLLLGTYSNFSITSSGCTASDMSTKVINSPSLPTATLTGSGEQCQRGTSPVLTFTASNGSAPYRFGYRMNAGSVLYVESAGAVATLPVSTQVAGLYTFTLESVSDAKGCSQMQSGSAVVKIKGKPTITLTALQQTFQEGNSQKVCDTDANPVNGVQFSVSGACVSGMPVWRVQVGGGSWSTWSSTAPITQLSNSQPYRYQAACDVNCPVTYTDPIELTIHYRSSIPQNVYLVTDGATVAEGETKEVCTAGTSLMIHATCASGETVLYSVDGGDYDIGLPAALVDNQFHNYRVRCRKADGTPSCAESESGVMRLKLIAIPSAPSVSLLPERSCNPLANFQGQTSCGSLRTVWYNAMTDAALPNLPSIVPTTTRSYYARCQTENGCISDKSKVVTFTFIDSQAAPIVSVSQEVVCTGTIVTVSANCPVGSSTFWNTGVTTSSFNVSFNNITKQTYWAKCLLDDGCQTLESAHKNVYWDAFAVTLINVGKSQSASKPTNNRNEWASQFLTRDGGPDLVESSFQNPTLYFVENPNKTAPRYWTVNAETCSLGNEGSLTFDMSTTPETGAIQSFNTHENTAPFFMYANREGWTELYAPNHPAFGFYLDNGVGGNVYDAGLPKGLYKLSVRYWDQKGLGLYPSTRKPQGNVLAYHEYWFRIQSKDGVGVGAAREGVPILSSGLTLSSFAEVMPNPVTHTLGLKVQKSKGQVVQTLLMDAAGRQVLHRQFVPETNTHQEELKVQELPTGIYFLQVKSGLQQTVLKVVKVD